MGVDSKKAPPLPAPTEESGSTITQTELATDVSRPADDEKSSYSLPEDGTPVTIKTRGHQSNKSQTSLLIEYFEGGKPTAAATTSGDRKPSVRVRLTPSKHRKNDRIQITETKSSSRKASLTRRQSPLTPKALKSQEALSVRSSGDLEDGKSMSSYASATEESNVSRNPIEVEIDSGGHRRRRRPASPLIPAADSKASYQPGNMSDISAIPTDSFLDGSGPSTKLGEGRRSRSPSRSGYIMGGAAVGAAALVAADKMRSKSRSDVKEKERIVLPKSSKERERSERRHKSKSRTSSGSGHRAEESKSGRRRSSKTHDESVVSGADSSVLSSTLTQSHRSYDASSMRSGASRSSINNPKLLETVEDAIRRLILPELNALKREQSKRGDRRSSGSMSTTTSLSKEDMASERRQSADKYSTKSRENLLRGQAKDRRDREARHELVESPAPSMSHESIDESVHEIEQTPHRSSDKLKAAAAGVALGGLAATALNEKSPAIAREQRRRRRAEAKGRASDRYPEEHDELLQPSAPMPLMSEVNPSEVTRTSILSADTERPHSASEELTPVQQVARGTPSIESTTESDTATPTKNHSLQNSLGTQHANISHGDLKTLPQRRTEGFEDEDEEEEYEAAQNYGQRAPIRQQDEYDDDEDYEQSAQYNDYYNTQDVPPPLKYVPYQPERRGLSPIPSVSGYTDGGSEVHNRGSRLTHRTSGSFSSPDKSIRHGVESPSVLSRNSYHDDYSVRSSGVDFRNTTCTGDSELDRVASGQAVRAVGANPDLVHSPVGVESHVASLVDGSMLEESVLTGESSHNGQRNSQHYGNRDSMATLEEEASRGHLSPKRSADSHRLDEADAVSDVSQSRPESRQSQEYEEYDIDEYGRKVPRSRYRQVESPTASEAAITGAAVGAAAAALRAAAQGKGKQPSVVDDDEHEFVGEGVLRNKSFKDRAKKEGFLPANTPTHSVDRLVTEFEKHEKPAVGHSGLPDLHDPMPEIGYFGHEDESRNGSAMSDRLSASHEVNRDEWDGAVTPTQESVRGQQDLHHQESGQSTQSGHSLGMDEAAGAAAIATAAALVHSHNRQASQGQEDDEWRRTSEDRKRDTIITNPYEGTSPMANVPGLNIPLGQAPTFDPNDYGDHYGTRSPLGPKIDEGYISQGPNRTPDFKGKAIDYGQEPPMPGNDDPFYTPGAQDHLSGLSQGMASPLYDSATGTGIDRIESKDIIALMQHLMVRDAQRSARDTEILVTLVRTAAEMRNSFDDIKKMLADTEDVIITEVKDNTEKTVQRHIGGPRPFPGSAARSIHTGGSQVGTENDKKTRNLWKRAIKGLSSKGVNDLTRIEDMLMHLLTEVDVLKTQTAPGGTGADSRGSFDNIQPEVQYEQDRGYEPEGNAGTSTAGSHASQSGHLSIPRNPPGKLGYERQVSGHRISTVPEDEEEYEDDNVVILNHSNTNVLDANHEPQRGGSVPLGTPPHPVPAAQASLSNENTPRTDKGRKHKSSGSSSWFPKISRWSETTTSSVGKVFRNSRQSRDNDAGSYRINNQSRSGSDLAGYEDYPVTDPYGEDKLHSGFSEEGLQQHDPNQIDTDDMQFTTAGISRTPIPPSQSPLQTGSPGHPHQSHPASFMAPEDPKYKAHRNSLNLQHPQPRPGATEYFRNTLENSAQEFDTPTSPKSHDWAGSATSLSRFPGHQPRYSNGGDGYWGSSPAAGSSIAPPRPPKEPLEDGQHRATPPKSNRVSKLQKNSPLPYHSVESGYGTATGGAPSASYSGSPKPENRNLSGALGVPARRPSGPRAMNSKSPVPSLGSSQGDDDLRRRKRDTFGTVTSQDTDTF